MNYHLYPKINDILGNNVSYNHLVEPSVFFHELTVANI